MNYISDNTQSIKHSKIRKMFNKALEYDKPISFTIGEPDFTASYTKKQTLVLFCLGKRE